jgi:hypothetical protein
VFSSTLGVRLVLLLGDTVPLPAPYEVMSALTRAQVTMDAAGADGFQLTFQLTKDTVVDYGLLLSGRLDPFKRVVIGVVMGIVPEVLIDGVITHTQVNPGQEPGSATLTVTGKDLTQLMDLEQKHEEFPNQPDFVIAGRVLAGYAQYGVIPSPAPTTDVPISLQRTPRQSAETDLAFLRRMATRNGFVFYLEPVTFGVSTAYWGPEIRASIPQPALTANLGPHSNVKGLTFSSDSLAPVATRARFVEPFTRTVIPLPALPSLKLPPLTARPAQARRTEVSCTTGNANPAQAALASVAAATNAPDASTAEGEVDSVRYGHALRARKLVGVRGVGLSHGGFWFVRRVTHTLERGQYTQRFALSREGGTSLTPVVRP